MRLRFDDTAAFGRAMISISVASMIFQELEKLKRKALQSAKPEVALRLASLMIEISADAPVEVHCPQFFSRGLIHQDMGNRVYAAQDFERCLELDPSNRVAKAALQMVQERLEVSKIEPQAQNLQSTVASVESRGQAGSRLQ